MDKTQNIDEFIAEQPPEVQVLLKALKETIRAVIPDAEERMSWGMPTFWKSENIVHFMAFKKHIGFFPGGEAVGVFADRLEGYKNSKGTIQFPYDRPIDHELIADIVRWRAENVQNGSSTYAAPAARERYVMPDYIAAALEERGLFERYSARPPYQKNDYIAWISGAKRTETRERRLEQMLEELQSGDAYMGMAYRAK